MRYEFDAEKILYFENGQIVDTYRWSALQDIVADHENIKLVFGEGKENIWIPRKMGIAEQIDRLEGFLERNGHHPSG